MEVRGQITPMRDTLLNLAIGLLIAVLVVYLLLAANFESLRLAFVVLSTVPAVIAGVAVVLVATGTSLNIQSFMGAILAIGVAPRLQPAVEFRMVHQENPRAVVRQHPCRAGDVPRAAGAEKAVGSAFHQRANLVRDGVFVGEASSVTVQEFEKRSAMHGNI